MTRAASRLQIAQPALSQAIAQLEARIGVSLLERHPRGVTLTPAGERFMVKARAAVAAAADADLTAQAFARAASGTIDVGYIGPPAEYTAPDLFRRLAALAPEVEVVWRELPFPRGSTAGWLEQVDVAMCHMPRAEPDVRVRLLRAEPRAALVPRQHPLAERGELAVADLLEEPFISYHPDVQQAWAGFHSLDDHRGGPPARLTADRVADPPAMLVALASRRALTTVPACDAEVLVQVLRGIRAIPIVDADPAMIALTWRGEHHNPLVGALLSAVESLSTDNGKVTGGAGDASRAADADRDGSR